MASQGVRPCSISRKLRVSHGCVSKILQRYSETGSIKPGSTGGSKSKLLDPTVESKMGQYLSECPHILCHEIRRRLVDENVCDSNNVPSVTMIAKYLRKKNNPENNQQHTSDSSVNESTDQAVYENQDNESFLANKSLANVISLTHNRRLRTSFTHSQIELLESIFKHTHYPDASLRENVSQSTSLSDNKIQIWFSNRRAKWRKSSTQGSVKCEQQQHDDQQTKPQTTSNNLTINNIYTSQASNNQKNLQTYNSSSSTNNNPQSADFSYTNYANNFPSNQAFNPVMKSNYSQYTPGNTQESITSTTNNYPVDTFNSNSQLQNPMSNNSTPLYQSNNNNLRSQNSSSIALGSNNLSLDSPSSSTCSISPSNNQYGDYIKNNPYYYYQNQYYNDNLQKDVSFIFFYCYYSYFHLYINYLSIIFLGIDHTLFRLFSQLKFQQFRY